MGKRVLQTRRTALTSALTSMIGSTFADSSARAAQVDRQPTDQPPVPSLDPDARLPNGKSQRDAIAQEKHEQSLKDADSLVAIAEQIRDELRKAGNYVVPFSTVKKTEEAEKLARRIRGRLKT